jgi:hypothetical protein
MKCIYCKSNDTRKYREGTRKFYNIFFIRPAIGSDKDWLHSFLSHAEDAAMDDNINFNYDLSAIKCTQCKGTFLSLDVFKNHMRNIIVEKGITECIYKNSLSVKIKCKQPNNLSVFIYR